MSDRTRIIGIVLTIICLFLIAAAIVSAEVQSWQPFLVALAGLGLGLVVIALVAGVCWVWTR